MGKGERRSRAEMLEQTRCQLLQAAREHFSEYGYTATSMDELTASVGLTRGALYHHFGGKSGLMDAVVRDMDAELCVQLKAILYAGDEDPITALAERSRAYIEKTQTPAFQRIMLTDAPAVVADAIEETSKACIATLTEVLADAQRQKLVSPNVAPAVIATMLNGALADASRWVAAADDNERSERLRLALDSATALVEGLRIS